MKTKAEHLIENYLGDQFDSKELELAKQAALADMNIKKTKKRKDKNNAKKD